MTVYINKINPILRNYKDLEGQFISGKIYNIQRIEDRVALFKFYDETQMRVECNYPPLQEFINLKEFLKENLIDEDLETNFEINSDMHYPMKERYAYLYLQQASLKLNSKTYGFENEIFRQYFSKLFLEFFFKKIQKRFERLEKKPVFNLKYLKCAKKKFYNRNINRLLNEFYIGKMYIRIFFKKFLSKIILFTLKKFLEISKKKNVLNLPVLLYKSIYFGDFFLIPGLSSCITRIRTFREKRNFNSTAFQKSLFKKLSVFFLIKLVSKPTALDTKKYFKNFFVCKSFAAPKTKFSEYRYKQKIGRQIFNKKNALKFKLNKSV